MQVKITLADEHPLIRRGVRAMINDMNSAAGTGMAFTLADETQTTSELLKQLAQQLPDILLLGYTLSGTQSADPLSRMEGLALVKGLSQRYPTLKVILLTRYKNPQLIRLAIETGAKGYLSHNMSEKTFRDALTGVLNNEVYVEPALMKALFPAEKLTSEALSPREMDVLRLLCKGGNLTDVSRRMHLSIKTVSAHKIRAMEKLGVKNDCQLYCLLSRTRMFDITL